jgi:hypothetical protein
MTTTQTTLVREFLTLSYKVNDGELNYIGHWESYEGYDSSYKVARHQMNIQDGITKEILAKKLNPTNSWTVRTKYEKYELHTLFDASFY